MTIFNREPRVSLIGSMYGEGFAMFEVPEPDPVLGKDYTIYRRQFPLFTDDAKTRRAAISALREICDLYLRKTV